jgi:hypothetical protein
VGFFLSSINQITQWIVSGLFGGYTAANVLKWYWWRLNGYGYFWGMVVGITLQCFHLSLRPTFSRSTYFPFILLLSTIACIAGSLLTKPVEEETLKNFYRNVRPWGFWKPVHAMVAREDASIEPNNNAARDLGNCAVGIAWQMTLVTIPLYVVFRNFRGVIISLAVLVATTIFLKKFWYDQLERN